MSFIEGIDARIRIDLEEELSKVPEGQKIHKDKFLLESLIFEEGKTKRIAWSGPFLRKLDLSEVSFDNVIWYNFEDKPVDLSGTNVNINFLHSWNGVNGSDIIIHNCNLSGVDLSKSHTEYVHQIINSDLSHTNATLDMGCFWDWADQEKDNRMYSNSNFEGIDLSDEALDARYMNMSRYCAWNNNFKNTGVTIMDSLHYSLVDVSEYDIEMFSAFYQSLRKGFLDGCKMGSIIDSNITRYKKYYFLNNLISCDEPENGNTIPVIAPRDQELKITLRKQR